MGSESGFPFTMDAADGRDAEKRDRPIAISVISPLDLWEGQINIWCLIVRSSSMSEGEDEHAVHGKE